MLKKEYRDFHRKPHAYMKLYALKDDKITEWIVFILGPPETIYAGGIFKALIRFPDAFPMDPPSVQFMSKFFHPNVYRDGKVCISTLQHPIPEEHRDETFDGTGYWSPANGIETILMSIISLFSDPNPNDPANADAAGMYTTDRKQFIERVKETIRTSIAEKPEDLEIEAEVEHTPSQVESVVDDLNSPTASDFGSDFDSASDGEVGQADSEDEDGDSQMSPVPC